MPNNFLPHNKATRARSRSRSTPARGPPRGSASFPVVGIGASAGGLDACRKLFDALPAGTGMAFILIQHLDPTHESMMADLLAGHTTLIIREAAEGVPIEREHLYLIPPGIFLSVINGALHLSQPQQRHGARLPFDFLLHSLAEEYESNAVCVVLSGTGADGSLGVRAVKERGGFIIAQYPEEAGHDGMPRSAIKTGGVDLVVPANEIPAALIKYAQSRSPSAPQSLLAQQDSVGAHLPDIINLVREKTAHDFTFYKKGTLQRRIERRMAMAAINNCDIGGYLELLRSDERELALLAKDLLINVTGFFRDTKVFDLLAEKTIPGLVRDHPLDRPLRIWIAACSTGEEAYSLAILFLEEINATKRNIKLQVFASDVDPEAVSGAREGVYPEIINRDVSAERLARFFSKEDRGYRVAPELRSVVVFTVQDLLADPPFSRLDMVSCRNLLIYLSHEAQMKLISLFHFALREGGILLIGNSETVGNVNGCFEVVSKTEHLYQRMGRSRQEALDFSGNYGEGLRTPPRPGQAPGAARQAALAELCRRIILETYAPAAMLINRKNEYLYSLGPIVRYLGIPSGYPTHDVLAMAIPDLRTKLRSAIQQAIQTNARVVVAGDRIQEEGGKVSFRIDILPVQCEGDELLLICFIDEEEAGRKRGPSATSRVKPRAVELEQALEAMRTELQSAIRNLEISSEEQKAVNEELLSLNEEYQSTNEELLTSKEELQSLNEELTALNGQLQETLERQRTTSNDLQNVLYSTDVATLFLDLDLNIRFFTPATKALFRVIPSDIGRPLADLSSLADDNALLFDAKSVLETLVPVEREIEAQSGVWFVRRILPYRTQEKGVEGVVITFSDITERRHTAIELEKAKRLAELASVTKSRFLAAASHDLRQPLQTLTLIQGLLTKIVSGNREQKLVARLDETLGAMSGMLNTLLDINQIEAGVVRADKNSFPINEMLDRLRDEFTYHAHAQRLELRVVPCSLSIYSDPRLLEQIVRNLLSNAVKYTKRGKVLLGCRRHQGILSIEIWDTGVGIPDHELEAIFDEYHQLDNIARERARGLGLGLAIVKRLTDLLEHRVSVQSNVAQGSVFSIEVGTLPGDVPKHPERNPRDRKERIVEDARRSGTILIIEDDAELRGLLKLLLEDEGHRAVVTPDGVEALELVARGTVRPDLILADYNLPNGMDGLQIAAKLCDVLHHPIPVIILTGDISTDTLRSIAQRDYVQLSKPVKLKEITQLVQRLLAAPRSVSAPRQLDRADPGISTKPATIFVVDDDSNICEGIRHVLEDDGQLVETYSSCEEFLSSYHSGQGACLLVDAYLPGMSGLELLLHLKDGGYGLPAIMITGKSDVSMAVQVMKAGALNFIEKPIGRGELLSSVRQALEQSRDSNKQLAWHEAAANHIASLTPRQHQIMARVLAGNPSKNIAADLGISQRTVENHRAAIMKKTGSKSLPALARLALAAAWSGPNEPLLQREDSDMET
jgi:two-component system CheB/CheR fusion protein